MMKRMLVLCMVVAALACSNAYGIWATSWTGAVSTDWMDAGNWTAGVPSTVTGAVAYLTGAPDLPAATIDNVDAGVSQWISIGGTAAGNYTVEMKNAAKFETSGGFYMQGAGASPLTAVVNFNMYGTSKYLCNAYVESGQMGGTGTSNIRLNDSAEFSIVGGNGMHLGNAGNQTNVYVKDNAKLSVGNINLGYWGGAGGDCYMSVQGNGTVKVTNELVVGSSATSTSAFDMGGGTVEAGTFTVGKLGGTGTLNMTGGVMTIAGNLSAQGGGAGQINVSGGTIYASDLDLSIYFDMMTVSGSGKVVLTGDKMDKVAGYIADSYLTVGLYYLSGGNTYLVPEPASMLLLGLGSLIFVRRNRR